MEQIVYSEIWEIINQLYPEDRKKIPNDFIEVINQKRDKNFISNIDLKQPLKNQRLTNKTKEILCYMELNYLATEQQKEELKNIYSENEKRIYEETNVEKIFAKRRENIASSTGSKKEEASTGSKFVPVVVKKEKWYEKIINFIKKFTRRNK